jgi:hypothetical protein
MFVIFTSIGVFVASLVDSKLVISGSIISFVKELFDVV